MSQKLRISLQFPAEPTSDKGKKIISRQVTCALADEIERILESLSTVGAIVVEVVIPAAEFRDGLGVYRKLEVVLDGTVEAEAVLAATEARLAAEINGFIDRLEKHACSSIVIYRDEDVYADLAGATTV